MKQNFLQTFQSNLFLAELRVGAVVVYPQDSAKLRPDSRLEVHRRISESMDHLFVPSYPKASQALPHLLDETRRELE